MSEYSIFTSESVSEGHPDKIAASDFLCGLRFDFKRGQVLTLTIYN